MMGRVMQGVYCIALILTHGLAMAGNDGIRFECAPSSTMAIDMQMSDYLEHLGIRQNLIASRIDAASGVLEYTLDTPETDTSTLDISDRPALEVPQAVVRLPWKHGRLRDVPTVSKKEIVLSLLQHGRLTIFSGEACNIQALKDHVGVRQNIAAWAEHLNWAWPNGGRAMWNKAYWRNGTPLPGHPLGEAVTDVFVHPRKYKVGCYTATKIIYLQGMLDYYARVSPNPRMTRLLKRRLLKDGEPLVGIEPNVMWAFEQDFDAANAGRPGKLARIQYGIAKHHFVPGDWVYLLNTDPASSQKTGYEGSNAIYLGRNRFDDYYNDNDHAYSFHQKLDEVYQWRHGVFSRSRDAAKLQALSPDDFEVLANAPEDGGVLLPLRVSPYYFGYEMLP